MHEIHISICHFASSNSIKHILFLSLGNIKSLIVVKWVAVKIVAAVLSQPVSLVDKNSHM